MLTELHIENFGIIEEVRFRPEQGLNVLTGETGAGKSLLLQAIDCLLGARAGSGLVRNGQTRALVEGVFEVSGNQGVKKALQNLSIADADSLSVRREISVEGRSRAQINGITVNLSTLRDITAGLVEIHGQHDHQRLLDPEVHLDYLDIYAGTTGLAEKVAELFRRRSSMARKLKSVTLEEGEKSRRLDFLRFAIEEIDSFAPVSGEYEDLEQEKALMQNSGDLFRDIGEAYSLLQTEERSALSLIENGEDLLSRHSDILPGLSEQLHLLSESRYRLEEVIEFLRSERDRLHFSPERLEDVEERLAGYRRMFKKYGHSTESVLAANEEFLRELSSIEMSEEESELLKSELKVVSSELAELAEELSVKRRSVVASLEQRLSEELAMLGMPGSGIEISVTREMKNPSPEQKPLKPKFKIHDRGYDRVEFLLRANQGEATLPLRKIASGGELSRIMLALKSTIMESNPAGTVIFDEIDTGVGGEIAHAIGERLQRLAAQGQVMVVTHLHQIASVANRHFRISKEMQNGRTYSRIDRLGGDDRIQEMARMLGGQKSGSAVIEHARQLLQEAV